MWKIIVFAVAALILAGAVFFSYNSTKEGESASYSTVEISKGHIISTVSATGTLSPRVIVEVGSQVSGRILELMVDFNSPVTSGQVIAKLDPGIFKTDVTRARANVMAAQAGLRRAQAELEEARRRHGRTSRLATQDLVAQADADTAQSQLESAKAQLESARAGLAQARAALEQAETNLAYTTIVSPIDGIVISRDVDAGQTVAASLQAPTLYTIAEDLSRMEIHTNVAEADVGRIEPEMRVEFTVDAWPGRSFTGDVKEVRYAPRTVQNVVTYNAVVSVKNPDGRLRPGMTADVSFIIDEKKDAILIPNSALRYRPPREIINAYEEKMRSLSAQKGSPASLTSEAVPTPHEASGTGTMKGSGGGRGDGSGRGGMGKGGGMGREGSKGPSGLGPPEPDSIRVVWRPDSQGRPEPLRIRTGITDGRNTEVLRGLDAGDIVIIGGASASNTRSAPSGAGRGGMRGGFL